MLTIPTSPDENVAKLTTSTSLAHKIVKIVDSATDTECWFLLLVLYDDVIEVHILFVRETGIESQLVHKWLIINVDCLSGASSNDVST